MPALSAPKLSNDAASDRLCQTLVGWALIASQNELQAFQSRYTLVFATMSFGIGICTILAQHDSLIPGFLFLLCMVSFSLRLNHHYDRKSRAWSNARIQLENLNYVVSCHGASLGKSRPFNIKKPHQIWQMFYDEYAVRPLDILSKLFYSIAMLVLIGTACVILSKYQIYFEIVPRG
ncbi:MAG: hypothetical protein ACR2QF_13440 [Geminicoccaceae bacterium]